MKSPVFTLLPGLLFAAFRLAAAPLIWLEEPARQQFNYTLDWPLLTGTGAVALLPDAPRPEVPFLEYDFRVETPGEYFLWGRTFDPAWSSRSRWRLDGGEWRDWQPGESVSREIHDGAFVLDWCLWGTLELTAGEHTIRLEILDKRPQNDYHYFVSDALALAMDRNFRPQGGRTPEEEAQELRRELADLTVMWQDRARADRTMAEADADAAASPQDTDARRRLQLRLNQARSQSLAASVDDGSTLLMHGRTEKVEVRDGVVYLEMTWNHPWSGRYWVGLLHDRALYGFVTGEILQPSRSARIEFPLPANLPAGRIQVECIPLGTPWAVTAPGSFQLAAATSEPVKPLSWGIYRDKARFAHPWSVTESNMLLWEGEPVLPFGGMMNTRVTWGTHTGDPDRDGGHLDAGLELIKAKYDVLKQYGLDDVYFNGFFVHSNPNYMRQVIELTEAYNFKYGLELSSIPTHCDAGFVRRKAGEIAVEAGAAGASIRTNTAGDASNDAAGDDVRLLQHHRCLWALLDADDGLLAAGVGVLRPEPGEAGKAAPLSMEVSFGRTAPAGARLVYLPEVVLSAHDPAAYLESIDDYCAKVKALYGSFNYGGNLRFFIDPLLNEMLHPPEAVPSGEKFRRRYAEWLFRRYGGIAELNLLWGALEPLPDLGTAARLIPLTERDGSSDWIDPESGRCYRFHTAGAAALRDLKEFRGRLCLEMINRVTDTLKSIADVPVLLKHNTWFSDWFVNTETAGGMDGVGMESYCYGDSLAYHNSVVVYAEAMQAARSQWCLVTESSAAAFEGQKDYCGYPDRFQMMDDIDQLSMHGAKGFYHFGFSFDPDGGTFFTTELLRDPRQLEWLATHAAIYRAAAERLRDYRPEVYGWYPGYLRERTLVGGGPRPFDIDGNYMAQPTQIRMMPDGSWLVPAVNPDADWRGLLLDLPVMTPYQRNLLTAAKPDFPVVPLGGETPLDSFTASGIGVIPPVPGNPDRLDAFRREVLGIRTFRTADVNGVELADGRVLAWCAVECPEAELRLPPGATAASLAGETLSIDGNTLKLVRAPYEKSTDPLPPSLPNGYHYRDNGQPETVWLGGVSAEELLALNPPEYRRWLPPAVTPEQVRAFSEAEAFAATTFNQPSLVGFSRCSGDRSIGLNTHWGPPEGQHYRAEYQVTLDRPLAGGEFLLRRMDAPALDVEVFVDGNRVGVIPADAELEGVMHLNPWSAGLSRDNLNIGWARLPLPELAAGTHAVELRLAGSAESFQASTRLLGGVAEAMLAGDYRSVQLFAIQIDCFALVGR